MKQLKCFKFVNIQMMAHLFSEEILFIVKRCGSFFHEIVLVNVVLVSELVMW